MIKNLLVVFLACTTAWLAFLVSRGESLRGPDNASASRSALPGPEIAPPVASAAKNIPAPPAQSELATLRSQNGELHNLVRDLQAEVSILNARRMPAPKAAVDPTSLSQPAQRLLVAMLGNKETAGLALDWIKADQAPRYASLLALANLDDAQREQLRTLLANRYATRLELAAADAESLSAAQQQQVDGNLRGQIEQLVGSDIAGLFDKADGKPISFDGIQRLDTRLRFEAQPLTREQYLPLWNLMSSQVFYTSPGDTPQTILQRRIDGANAISEGARSILTPSQLKVLDAQLHDNLAPARAQAAVLSAAPGLPPPIAAPAAASPPR